MSGPLPVRPELVADLHAEDDDGNNWALVDVDDFVPARIYPGAVVTAGSSDGFTIVKVTRTELLNVRGEPAVLVTFFQLGLRTLDEALNI